MFCSRLRLFRGALVADYPYGEQDSSICATSSTTTHKFTGKERDSEDGLDDFGARYYSSSLGRFISADWSAVLA
jgi:RHS repeat-associated protein